MKVYSASERKVAQRVTLSRSGILGVPEPLIHLTDGATIKMPRISTAEPYPTVLHESLDNS